MEDLKITRFRLSAEAASVHDVLSLIRTLDDGCANRFPTAEANGPTGSSLNCGIRQLFSFDAFSLDPHVTSGRRMDTDNEANPLSR